MIESDTLNKALKILPKNWKLVICKRIREGNKESRLNPDTIQRIVFNGEINRYSLDVIKEFTILVGEFKIKKSTSQEQIEKLKTVLSI